MPAAAGKRETELCLAILMIAEIWFCKGSPNVRSSVYSILDKSAVFVSFLVKSTGISAIL